MTTATPSIQRRATGVALDPTRARFEPGLPFAAWEEVGGRIGSRSNATLWWLGDWLVFGRREYGRRYKDAIAATGLDPQTLRNYATVARRFEPARRCAFVTFQHHAEVCALPDELQDELLGAAALHGWSRNELRRQVRALHRPQLPAPDRVVLTVEADGDQWERWRTAATCASLTPEQWAARTLDDSARALAAQDLPRLVE